MIIIYLQPTGADPTVENVNGNKPIDYTKNQSLQMVLATAETKVCPSMAYTQCPPNISQIFQ